MFSNALIFSAVLLSFEVLIGLQVLINVHDIKEFHISAVECSHAVHIPALATPWVFLMSYTKILLTVIEYGSGKHLILVVFSCGVQVIGLAYPVLVLSFPLLERFSHKCIPHKWNLLAKFKPLLEDLIKTSIGSGQE